jgi:VanZ family protein
LERKYYILLSLLWVVFITTLSLVSFNTNAFSTVKNTDKIVHFLFYFVFTLLLLKSFNNKIKYKYLIVIGLAVSYGIIIEVLQNMFTLTRKAELFDVFANTTGVISAVLLNKYIFKCISSNIIKKD